MKKSIFPVILSCLALLTAAPVVADETQVPDTETPPEGPRIDLSGLHPVAQAVARAGALACAMKTHEAVFYLIAETESGGMVHFRTPDLLSFSFETIDFDGVASYISLNVAPGKEDHCAIGYEVVTHWPQSCESIAEEQYADMTVGNVLREKLLPLSIEGGPHVFLQPVDGGCNAIRKEIIP